MLNTLNALPIFSNPVSVLFGMLRDRGFPRHNRSAQLALPNALEGVMIRTPGDRLIRLREVVEWTGLSKTEVYRRMSEGRFPRAFKIGVVSIRWQSEVADWLASVTTVSQQSRVDLAATAA